MASGLCDKLTAAEAAAARGNTKAADNVLDAYLSQLRAQAGKAFTAEEADVLANLISDLR